jgi:hypothetical protein
MAMSAKRVGFVISERAGLRGRGDRSGRPSLVAHAIPSRGVDGAAPAGRRLLENFFALVDVL